MPETRSIPVVFKGIDQRWGADAGQATKITDLWYDGRGGWSSAGGYRRIISGGIGGNPFAASGAIESIHFFSQHNGTRRWLIYINGSGSLYAFNPATAARSSSPGDAAKDRSNTTLTRAVVQTPWQRSQSASWGDHFYLINGIDRALVFNGVFWDYAGFDSAPGAPYATSLLHPRADDDSGADVPLRNAGLGPTTLVDDTDYPCAYRYRVSFVNSRGQESPLSEPSDLVSFTNTGGTEVSCGAHLVRLALPVGGSEVVARRLYRTQNICDSSGTPVSGRGDVFYFHTEIQENISSVFEDGLPDGYLGSAVDPSQVGGWPLGAKYLAPFKGCMFLAVGGYLKYSRPGSPEVFPPDNIIDVGDAHLGPITAIYATRNALVVFKARGVYLVKGDATSGFSGQTLTREVGCVAQNTVREIPGVGLGFLSDNAYTVLQGTLENDSTQTQTVNLTTPLPNTMRRLNRSAAINACAAVYHQDRELWIAIPTIGFADNNLVLVFHYEVMQWSLREKYPIASMLETPDVRGHLLFASYASTTTRSPDGSVHLGIMVYSRGWADKDGTSIQPLYQTGNFTASPYRSIRPKSVIVQGVLHGNNDLGVNVNSNRSQVAWLQTSDMQDQQYPQDLSPVFGAALFDDTSTGNVWQLWRMGAMRFDVEKVDAGPIHEFTVTLQPASGSRLMTVHGMSLEVIVDGDEPVKPLRAARTGGGP